MGIRGNRQASHGNIIRMMHEKHEGEDSNCIMQGRGGIPHISILTNRLPYCIKNFPMARGAKFKSIKSGVRSENEVDSMEMGNGRGFGGGCTHIGMAMAIAILSFPLVA